MGNLKKPTLTDAPVPIPDEIHADYFGEHFPLLVEHLTQERWDDNTTRETSTINLSYGDGHVKACLNDRAGNQYFFLSAESVMNALLELEAKLASGRADWRTSKPREKGRPAK